MSLLESVSSDEPGSQPLGSEIALQSVADAPGRCANCDAALTGPFCAECGQKHHAGAPSLGHVLQEFADDYLHFDSKLPQTLWALLSRPGFLTAEFLGGRRARYVGPFKLYVLCSLIFFFCQMILIPYRVGQHPLPAAKDAPIEVSQLEAQRNPPARWVGKLLGAKIDHKRPSEIQREIRRSLGQYLPDAMLVLLPLVALLFKLLEWRRYYAEHFVMALHLHAVGYLAFAVMVAAQRPEVSLPLLAAFAVYVVLAFRRVYAQGWFRTLLEASVLGIVYPFAVMAMVIAVAVGGVWFGA